MNAGSNPPLVRDALEKDFTAIQAIYADEVLHGVSSWEQQPPDIDEMKDRHASIVAAGFPYRVLQVNGELAGYSYASK